MDEQILETRLSFLDDLQSKCTHCGLCLETCITFQASGWEHESPRGRIRLAQDWINGKINLQSNALETFNHCLGCQACEKVCPTSVQYGEIRHCVQELRSHLNSQKKTFISRKTYQKWIQTAYRMGSLFWRHYGWRWLNFSFLPLKIRGSYLKTKVQKVENQIELNLVVSCIQDVFTHSIIEHSINLLSRLGYSVCLYKNQPCCGAILDRLIQGGEESICYQVERQQAQNYQKKREEAFFKWMPEQTYFLSMGCQCFINRHAINQKKVGQDLYTLIQQSLNQQNLKLILQEPLTAYYQPYCQQDKGGKDPIWQLLNQIEGLTLKYINNPYACCGGYKGEYIFHPQQAAHLLKNKLINIPLGATVIITSVDCQGQFLTHASSHLLKILYPIEIMAQANCIKK